MDLPDLKEEQGDNWLKVIPGAGWGLGAAFPPLSSAPTRHKVLQG